MSKAARRQRVNDIIKELDLERCQDTQIGIIGKGISGGERRRLAIGLEILNEPSLLLLVCVVVFFFFKTIVYYYCFCFIIYYRMNQHLVLIVHQL